MDLIIYLLVSYLIGALVFVFKKPLRLYETFSNEGEQSSHATYAAVFIFSPVMMPFFVIIGGLLLLLDLVTNLSAKADALGEFIVDMFRGEKSAELDQLKQELAALKEQIKESK